MTGVFNLWAVQIPHSDIEQAGDPFAVGLWWTHRDREVQRPSQQCHVGDGFHRRCGMLHVHPGKIESRGLQQSQYCRIAHQVDPGADLKLTAIDSCPQGIASHCFLLTRQAAVSMALWCPSNAGACRRVILSARTKGVGLTWRRAFSTLCIASSRARRIVEFPVGGVGCKAKLILFVGIDENFFSIRVMRPLYAGPSQY